MSKSTFVSAARATVAVVTPPRYGVIGRFFAALSRARQLQADREVETYLARQSDRMLGDIGMTDAEIKDLRQRHQQ
jgi:hypothetical protein